MNTTLDLANFETAQEILNRLVAHTVAKINWEEQKSDPDLRQIQQYEASQKLYMDEYDALQFRNEPEIKRVIDTYGPIARAINDD